MNNKLTLSAIAFTAFAIFAVTQITIFSTESSDAFPGGTTMIIWKLPTTKFLDSDDSWCRRQNGYSSATCRVKSPPKIGKEAGVIMHLPQMYFLYRLSGGNSETYHWFR